MSGDAGSTVRVTVAATNAGGTTLAVSAASSTIAAAPSSPPPPSGTYSQFGISTGWQLPWISSADQTTYYNDTQAMGVGMLRFDINWTSIQAGGPTSYNWAPQDAVVHGAMAHGMKILAMIAYTPAWARASGTTDKNPPTNVSDYGNFCKATAQHYSPMGVHAYEVWNEPNTAGMFAPTPERREVHGDAEGVLHGDQVGRLQFDRGHRWDGSGGQVQRLRLVVDRQPDQLARRDLCERW